MAERRMFAKTIIDSDVFLDMPVSARLLYYDLAMRADDDGFNNSPRKIMRMIGATSDDMNILITRNFVIPFESGVVVIKHWRIHNYIAKDRYKETKYKEEKSLLTIDENNAYTYCIQDVDNTYTGCIQDVCECETQVRLGKVRLGKVIEERKKERKEAPAALPPVAFGDEENEITAETKVAEGRQVRKKPKKKSSYDEILESVEDESLRNLYLEFIKMRQLIKAPMTDRALEMLITKVRTIEPDSLERQKKLLETAIINNWKSVYPLKERGGKKNGKPAKPDKPDPWAALRNRDII